jgi:NitT/TauT family transport system permease protein
VYVVLVLLWQSSSTVLKVPVYLLPPPSAIVNRVGANPDKVLTHSLITLQEVLGGFALGVAVSLPLGLLIVTSRWLERLIYPLLVAFQAIPKVALAPILVVWFGFGLNSKIMLGFVTAIFPIVVNTVIGLNQTPPEMLHLMRSLGASRLQTFYKIRLFVAAPYIFGGFKVGITLAVVGAVVGEFIASNSGLGYLLLTSNNAFDTPMLFGVVVILSIISVALFYLVDVVERLLLPPPLRRKGVELNPGAQG